MAESSPESDSQQQPAKVVPKYQTLAGVAGNILEWYDFSVYGFFSTTIANVFFPSQEGNSALVESFAVFGGAFLMRPVGGLLMGWIGDKYGRKRALEISIFLMAVPTFAMGCLPTYDQVGALATVLLIVVRLLQGLSVGGQLMSSLVFTLENQPKPKWGLYGSYVCAAANFGTLCGGLVAAFFHGVLSEEELERYGWRLPFLFGIVVSICGMYLRWACDEDFGEEEAPKNPIKRAFAKGSRRTLCASCLVPMVWSSGFYLCFVWMAIFMADLVEPPVPQAFWVNSVSLFLSVCLFFPVAGWMSDKFGRIRVMMIGGVSFAISAPICVALIAQGNAPLAFFAQMVMGVFLSLWGAPLFAWLAESFEPDARLTSVAIGYNVAQALCGSITPSLATVFVDRISVASPGLLITGIAIISIIGLKCVAPPGKETLPVVKAEDEKVADKEIS